MTLHTTQSDQAKTRRWGKLAAPFAALATVVVLFVLTARRHLPSETTETTSSRDRAAAPVLPIAECLVKQPARIAHSVYLLGDMRPSAAYVVETSAGLAMIDSGLDSSHDRLLAGLARLDLDIGRLKMILLTHAHGDHSMGAQRLREETGAAVYVGRDDAPPLRRGAPWEAIFSKFDIADETTHPTTIDGELTDGQVLELGEARFTVVATPGHTPGSCCFLLEIDGQRLLFTGDTVSTFTAALGTYSARLPPSYRGDAQSYLASLQKLRDLPVPDLLLPGHPSADMAAPDPHFTAADWKSLIDRGIDDLRLINERYVRDGADFLDGTPKKILENVYYLGDFEGRATYALVDDDRAILFNGVHSPDAWQQLASRWNMLGVPAPQIWAVFLTTVDPEGLAGLHAVVCDTGCRVVVPGEGIEVVAGQCPPGTSLILADELKASDWTDLRSLPVSGLRRPEAVYYFRRNNSLVLVSGDVPMDVDAIEAGRLKRRGPPDGWNVGSFSDSLAQLAEIKPDVWLAANPLRGRNANLYDRAWANILSLNHQLLQYWKTPSGSADGS